MKSQKNVLVLDFDGLICDGLNECILVTWNGYHQRSLSAFSDQGLASIPDEFVERFKYYRNFARHLGHFLIPLLDFSPLLQTQEEFDALYASFLPQEIDTFVEKVTSYRNQARNERRETWLSYHTLYNGMKPYLSDLRVPTYIATAKDSESTVEILKHNGILFEKANVFGEQRSKLVALEAIRQRENVSAHEITFFDDNIMNVEEARRAGHQAYWATWGYNAPSHFQYAQMHNIPKIELADLRSNC